MGGIIQGAPDAAGVSHGGGDDAPGRALTAFLDDVRAAAPGAAAPGAAPFEETEDALHGSSLYRTAAVS